MLCLNYGVGPLLNELMLSEWPGAFKLIYGRVQENHCQSAKGKYYLALGSRALSFVIIFLFTSFTPVQSETGSAINGDKNRNPHFQSGQCNICHAGTRPRPIKPRLVEKLCEKCHLPEKGLLEHHPVNIDVLRNNDMPFSDRLPLVEGKLTCITCHDLIIQCKMEETGAMDNRAFLRGGPYSAPWDICYLCHDSRLYEGSSPHDQINDQGIIQEETCWYCHQPPEEESHTEKLNVGPIMEDICLSCHGHKTHPAGAVHTVKPSPKLQAFMQFTSQKQGVFLPLNSKEEIYCATCHNPHEKGLIDANDPKARGAEGDQPQNYRKRILGKQMCLACHSFGMFGGQQNYFK